MLVESFFGYFKNSNFVWTTFQNIQSEENTKKSKKIAKITVTITKIGCLAPFGVGNISGCFWIQNRLNVCIYIVHTIFNIFVLALGKRKIPPTYKQP